MINLSRGYAMHDKLNRIIGEPSGCFKIMTYNWATVELEPELLLCFIYLQMLWPVEWCE